MKFLTKRSKVLYLCRPLFKGNGFAPWCNGSTPVFGTVCLGSNPGGATLKRSSYIWKTFFLWLSAK